MKYITKVDSTRISIPLEECQIIDNNLIELISHPSVNTVTGEQLNETFTVGQANIRDNKNIDGTYFKVYLERSQFIYVDGVRTNKPYLSILLNSKQLTTKYFTGITKDTFRELYEIIMRENVFTCSYESFQNARYNDTDICFDFKATVKEFDVLKKNIRRSALDPSKWFSVNKKDNSGLWSPVQKDPRGGATPSSPYIKFYSKEIDMKGQSRPFADAYLKQNSYIDVYRCEATVKNVKHKRRLGLEEVKTIWQFLNQDLQSLMILMSNEYFTKQTLIKSTGLTPSNYIMLNLINLSIKKGATRAEIIKSFDLKQNGVTKKSCHNAIQQYHKIMSSDEVDKSTLKLNELSSDVMEFLGIDKTKKV